MISTRLKEGFYRDGHGDLHSRNIFLLAEPVPFDCIEFNDDFRQIDVLNEVAFLCMDLEAFGRQDLSDCFLESYNALFPAIKTRVLPFGIHHPARFLTPLYGINWVINMSRSEREKYAHR